MPRLAKSKAVITLGSVGYATLGDYINHKNSVKYRQESLIERILVSGGAEQRLDPGIGRPPSRFRQFGGVAIGDEEALWRCGLGSRRIAAMIASANLSIVAWSTVTQSPTASSSPTRCCRFIRLGM